MGTEMEHSSRPSPTRNFHMGGRMVSTLGFLATSHIVMLTNATDASLHSSSTVDEACFWTTSPAEGAARGIDGDDPLGMTGHATATPVDTSIFATLTQTPEQLAGAVISRGHRGISQPAYVAPVDDDPLGVGMSRPPIPRLIPSQPLPVIRRVATMEQGGLGHLHWMEQG